MSERRIVLEYTGAMRVHFNRHGAAPLVWSIDLPGCELNVAEVLMDTPVVTVYSPKTTPDDEDGKPSAWLKTYGHLRVYEGGHAVVRPLGGWSP